MCVVPEQRLWKKSFPRDHFLQWHKDVCVIERSYWEIVCFLKKVKLDYVGFFAYSREPGTAAYNMKQVRHFVKRKRLHLIEKVQQEILDAKHQNEKGKVVHVVCDAVADGVARCRTAAQSPDVDPCIYVEQTEHDELFVVGQEYDIVLWFADLPACIESVNYVLI